MIRALALTSLCLLLAATVVWELAEPETAPGPAVQTAATVEPKKTPPPVFNADALTETVDTIVERPLFSPARRPAAKTAAAPAGAGGKPDTGLPRLAGTLVGPDGGRAIFAGADGKPRTAAAGDAIGAFTIQTIVPGTVVLSGPEGERVLHPSYVSTPAVPGSAPAPVAAAPPQSKRGSR